MFRFVDIGVYGVPKRPGFNAEVVTRKIEDFVRSGLDIYTLKMLRICF